MNKIEVELENQLERIVEGLDGEIRLPVAWIGIEEEQFCSVLARFSDHYPNLEIVMTFSQSFSRCYPEVSGEIHLRRKQKPFDKGKAETAVKSRFQPHFLGNWDRYSDKYGLKTMLDQLNEWIMCPTCRKFLVYKDETETILKCPECGFEKPATPVPRVDDIDLYEVWIKKRIREDTGLIPDI